jgi:26S proteasome regulatory subunit N1
MKRQLAFILARAQVPLEWLQPPSVGDAEIATDEELSDDLECLYITKLSTHFRDFGKELGVADAKSLEDIYKSHDSHLENTRKLPLCSIVFLSLPFPIHRRPWYFSKS